MQHLKNIIVGFLKKNQMDKVQEYMESIDFKADDWHFLNKTEAKNEFLEPDKGSSDFFERINRIFHRQIGGGPTEFLRDIDQMNSDEVLFVANVESVDEAVKEEIRDVMKKCNLRQSKHFGSYSVEHLTMEEGHDDEMPLVNQA